MKKILVVGLILGLVVVVISLITSKVFAATSITSVTLNGGTSVVVAPGDSITAVLYATNSSGTHWNRTGWNISTSSGPINCTSNPNPNFITDGSHSTSFTITAPSTPGTYNAYFITSNNTNSSCSSVTGSITMTGAVIVKEPRSTDSAVLNGLASVSVTPGATISAAITGTILDGYDWHSTGWRISTTAPGSMTCAQESPMTSDDHDSAGTYTNTFNITAPSTPNTYNAYFRISGSNGNCLNEQGTLLTIPNAVIVTPPITPTTLSVSSATGTYGGTINLSATLLPAFSGATVNFKLNGSSAGSGTTNGSGVATETGVSLANINSGSYSGGVTASFSGDGSHSSSSNSGSLSVTKRPITVTAVSNSKIYDGTASSTGVPTITLGSLASGDSANWTESFDNKNVNTGKTLKPSGTVRDGNGGNNYSVTFVNNTNGTITAKPMTVSAVGNDKEYDGTATATVNLSTDKLSGDIVTASYTSANFSDQYAGIGKSISVSGISISGADSGNYSLTSNTANTTANITQRPLTITANDLTKYFGNPYHFSGGEFSITDGTLVGGDLISSVTLESDGAAADAATSTSPYAIIPSDAVFSSGLAGNYDINYVSGKMTVSDKIVPSITWPNPADITYGTALDSTQLNATTSVDGTFDYAPSIGTVLGAGSGQSLKANFTPTDKDTYAITSAYATINVLKKDITVMADPKTKVYGNTDPALTYQISTSTPLITGDSLSGDLIRETGGNIGKYAIGQGTLTAGGDYNLTFVPNNLEITTKGLSITANNASKIVSSTLTFAGTEFTSNGLINEDGVTHVNLTSGGADASAAVGTYNIVPSDATGSGLSNYFITYNNGTLTVSAADAAKSILSFNLDALVPPVIGSINEESHTISLSVPYGTDVTNLVPTITISENATVNPQSGVGENFTNPVTYTVIAQDQSTQNYLVTVTVGANPNSGNDQPNPGGEGGIYTGTYGNTSPFGAGQVLGTSTVGEVLGTSTVAEIVPCIPLLTQFHWYGGNNNKTEIIALQNFLNQNLGINLPLSGIFGRLTFAAVKQFQLKYKDQILAPWIPFGLSGGNNPTGHVYKTTLWWINSLNCASSTTSSTLPMPNLP